MRKSNGFFVLILLGILAIFLYIPKIYQGHRTMINLQKELENMNQKSIVLKKEEEKLSFRVDELDNLYAVEKFVRNRLAMKKKDETIYRVIYEEEDKK
jgi:cell division protein FtsB